MSEVVENKERSKEEIIERFKVARQGLFDSIKGLKFKEMASKELDGWSVKDIIAHIIEWDIKSVEDASKLIRGEQIETKHLEDMDRFNTEALEQYKIWSMRDVLTGLGLTTRKVMTFLNRTTESELLKDNGQRLNGEKITAGWMIDYADHDEEHAAQIQEWWKQKGLIRGLK